MSAQGKKIIRDDVSAPIAEMAETLLPAIARKQAALRAPETPGTSFLYDVDRGWQTDALRLDKRVVVAMTTRALEEAMQDVAVTIILVPHDGSITRVAALQICSRHRQCKTIFYERQK